MASAQGNAQTRRKVSQKHVIYSEIISVTSAMRKNARWASSSHFAMPKGPALGSNLGLRLTAAPYSSGTSRYGGKELELMAGFHDLKRTLNDVDLSTVELPVLLAPFFAIIRSSLSTGPITSAALSALHSFFSCGLISPQSAALEPALIELSNTVAHCKFEASDSSGDEVVLLKIMTVIEDCLCGSVGEFLGDIEVCEMLETVLTTCCQIRLSETLRRSAERVMHALVRTVFSRLHDLDPDTEEAKLKEGEEAGQEGEIKMTVTAASTEPTPPSDERPQVPESTTTDLEVAPQESKPVEKDQEEVFEEHTSEEVDPEPPVSASYEIRPRYGLPSIIELLRVLINVLDPNDQQHTDSTRLIALGILNSAFEESGPRIPDFPSLLALIVDSGCKYLFQLARSENPSVLYLSLRTISTVFEGMTEHLKLQQELFLAFTISRLALPVPSNAARLQIAAGRRARSNSPRPGTPALPAAEGQDHDSGANTPTKAQIAPAQGETRYIMLEILSQLSRHSSFMVDLYANYDCDINCENLYEKLIDFLCKAVDAFDFTNHDQVQQRNALSLCLDLLLAFVNDMTTRAQGFADQWPPNFPSPESLLQTKSQKKLIIKGASLFNNSPKTGVAFLEENRLIYADLDNNVTKEQSLAQFLKSCTRLDKRLLGDYISKPNNIELLKAFIGLFDFKDKPIAEAMRELLESFRLPGEAQQIGRITETFASIYFASEPKEIKSEDAVYVLAYSVIMLNTDQHNPQIRKRMALEDYQKNLKGVNAGGNFSPEFLQNIYDSIRKREIVMPEEHTGQVGFEFAWKELLARSRQAGNYMVCNTPLFDIEMFKAVWKPVISAIAQTFITHEEEYIIQRAITGFKQCATLAGHFKLPDVFDYVVVSLSEATNLVPQTPVVRVPNFPVIDIEGQKVTVSNLSVRFGTNFKGQLAAVVLFNTVNGNGNALREGWLQASSAHSSLQPTLIQHIFQIFEMFTNLFLHSLLPIRMLQMEDFLGGVSMIPLQGSQPARAPPKSDGGLLSALSSYLMTPYGSSNESLVPNATDADIENTLSTIDCITSCRLDELYSQIMELDLEALVAAVRALEALAHERTVARLKLEGDEGSSQQNPFTLPYDPASVFLLEMMVSIASQTPQHIEELWPTIFEHLSALLSAASQYSILLIERAAVSLLKMCTILAQQPSLRDQVYLAFDLLATLPSVIASSLGEQIVSGLMLILQKHNDLIKSQTEWNLVFALIRSTLAHSDAARVSFKYIQGLVLEGPNQLITTDNFGGIVNILDEYALLAAKATEERMRHGRKAEPLTAANSPIVNRGKVTIDLLFSLYKYLPRLLESSQLSKPQAWKQQCLPLLVSMARHSASAAREIRHHSISQLQRILLGHHVLLDEASSEQVEEVFNRVVFHLIDDLLKPDVYERDPSGMAETRLRASALLCKSFMHLELRDSQTTADFRIVWIQVLDLLDRLMNIDRGGQLREAVPESLKNVVLVMNAANILVPPSSAENDERDQQQRTLWASTHERIERFLPGFLKDVIPAPTPP